MRRTVFALLGAAIGTTLLIGLKTQVAVTQLGLSAATPADASAGGDPANGQPSASGAAAGPTATATATGTSAAASTTAPAGKAVPSATAGATTKPPTATATVPKTTAPAPASRTILGDAVAAKDFGNMQVKIVVTGTHIDDIVTVQKSNRPGSVSTTLRTQALSAQSSNVGNVSGATYSSNAYKQSLQSAINKI